MANTSFRAEVVAIEERLFSDDATFVRAQTTEGEIGVMANHQPLLGQLIEGGTVLIEQTDGTRRVAAVQGGFIAVGPEVVTILAETAIWASDVDADAERQVLESAEPGSKAYVTAQSRLRAVEQLNA